MGKLLKSPAALVINEAVRPELVEFGSANLRDENIRQFHAGEASPRYGFTALANGLIDGTSPTSAYKLFADSSTVVRIADGLAETFDAESSKWVSLGRVPECTAAEVDLPSMGVASTLEDQAYCNGYICVGWNANAAATYAFYSIINATTRATVRAPEQLVSSSNVAATLVGTYGNYFIAVVADSGGTIKAWYLDTSSSATVVAGWVSIGTIAADYATFTFNGAAIQSLADRIAVFYVNTSGGTNRATVKTFNIGGVITTATVNTSSITPLATEVMGSIADTLWLSWNEFLNVRVMGVDGTTLATTSTVATMVTAISSASTIGMAQSATAGHGRILVTDTTSMIARDFLVSGGATTAGAAAVTIPGATPAGRPMQYLGRYYVPVFGGQTGGQPQNDQQTCILVDFTDNVTSVRPIASVAPGLAVVSTYHKGKTSPGPVSSTFYFGHNITRSSVANASALAEYDFADTSRWTPAAFGNSTFLTGGILSYSDGVRVAESGFLIRPTTPQGALSGAGITGTFRYVCVYEEVDADGNWCVSGLSSPSAVVSPANNTVTVTVLPLSVSGRLSAGIQNKTVRVAFYRTASGGVAPYYRLGTTINDTTLATVSFTDTTTDATLIARAELYSQPGVLGTSQDRRAPPGLALLTSYNGMLVGATGSNVWFSGQAVDGEGAWFNPIFQVPVPGQGDIMALAVMDGGLYIFKQREVYSIVGSPPSDNGATGGLGTPVRLACDVGCIESRSIATTALGIFFQSDRGIELLTRAQTVMWQGQKIQQQLASFPIVTSATVQPTPSGAYVLIELAASQSAGLVTGTGRTLVFDLSLNDWISTDRRTSVNSAADCPSQSACMIYTGNAWRYAWLATGGRVHYEDPTTYLDADGSFVVQLLETGYYNAFQNGTRVERGTVRYQRYSPAGITVETAYDDEDYSTDPESVATWTEDDTSQQIFLEWSPRPRGETVKFRITATAPAAANYGNGHGIGFISISLRLAEEQGPTNGTLLGDPALRR